MKYLLLLLPLLLASCSSVTPALKCDLEDGLEGVIAGGIEGVGMCTGTAAVRASVNTWIDKAGICATDSKQLKASAICGVIDAELSTAVGSGVTNLINNKFPGWNCSPTWIASGLETVAGGLCAAVTSALGVASAPMSHR